MMTIASADGEGRNNALKLTFVFGDNKAALPTRGIKHMVRGYGDSSPNFGLPFPPELYPECSFRMSGGLHSAESEVLGVMNRQP
ncbi:hypothetical protein NPIL_662011 [Nephila pilipes]|uniref:Uncharacterized protein n=1 Tax=Nephila pilipes TaxID=299642 RepID=A0A8X6P832_NEPPI|nr:hypothetical protein NPIL_662011 [Nephila pilipes]